MLDDEPETPVADKSRMLPAPSRSAGGLPPQRDIPREILRDQQPRDRDFARDPIREPQREAPREAVREAARDFGYTDPLRDNPRNGDTYRGHEEPALFQERDPIREIERDLARDIGRDLDRGTGIVREIGRDQMRGLAREVERNSNHDENSEDRNFRDREASRDIGRNPARDTIDRAERGRGDRASERRSDRSQRRDVKGDTSKRSGGSAWVAAISVLGLVAGLGWAGDTYREQIVSTFPQMSIVYDQLGRKVNAVGLDFQALSSSLEMAETGQVLVVRGQIVNITDREIAIPDVKVIVLDASKRDIHNWTFKPDARRLTPRGRTAFTTRLDSPPAEAADLELRFAKSGG